MASPYPCAFCLLVSKAQVSVPQNNQGRRGLKSCPAMVTGERGEGQRCSSSPKPFYLHLHVDLLFCPPGIFVLLKHFLSLSAEDPHTLLFTAPSPSGHPGQFISPFLRRSTISGLPPALLLWACQNSFTATVHVEHANSYRVKEAA